MAATNSIEFAVGQIVKGHIAGTFVILSFLSEPGSDLPAARVKTVDTFDHSRRGRGSIVLPLSMLREVVR